jgi:type IV pilus assembly protein PilN
VKIRMNLLPYREARRKENRQRFWAGFGVALGVAALAVGVGHMAIGGYISNQEARNNFVKSQNTILDERIKEIASLKENIDSLKAQQEIIGKLQSDRAAPTHLLDQMVRIVPTGMFLTNIIQKGSDIQVTGVAQSSDLVSNFMVAVQDSPYLIRPELIEIKAFVTKENRRYQQFSLKFSLRTAKDDKEKEEREAAELKKGGKPASAPAAAASAPATAASGSVAGTPSAPASAAAPVQTPAVAKPAMQAPAPNGPVKAN